MDELREGDPLAIAFEHLLDRRRDTSSWQDLAAYVRVVHLERRAYVAAGGYDDRARFDRPIARLEAMVAVLRAMEDRFPRRRDAIARADPP